MKFNFLISTTIVPNKMKKVNIFLQKSTKFLIIILIRNWQEINIVDIHNIYIDVTEVDNKRRCL